MYQNSSVTSKAEAEAAGFHKATHVIFDLDGLLLDTERVYKQVVMEIAEEYGKELPNEVRIKLMGTPEAAAAKIAISELELPVSVEEFMREQRRRSTNMFKAYSCRFMPGAEKLVMHFYKNKVPMAVATSSTQESFDLKTSNHKGLFSLFHHIVVGSDPEVKHGKPSPDIFLICAARFPEKPTADECLVFEDAPNGVTAARSAGMQCVMVPDPELITTPYQRATQVVKTLNEVKPELYGLPAIAVA